MIDVGKGYRQVYGENERRQRGDEFAFLNRGPMKWHPVGEYAFGLPIPVIQMGVVYRRPISQEKTEDAL